ncbi:MAG: hypothetical protein R6X20_11005 [Phycisphaerae bacterium]
MTLRTATRLALAVFVCTSSMVVANGCAAPLRFPAEPLRVTAASAGKRLAYDTDGDGQADYVAVTNDAGRITHIGYAPSGGEPETMVDLDGVPADQCRHLVLILDGVGYETVREWQAAGHLRLFHPPARVISTFPSMTDIALADAFQSIRPLGYEARYFDHPHNRLAGGDGDYLAMVNEDWVRCTDYRAPALVDPLSYLFPRHYFQEEMKALVSLIERRDRPMVVAYLVSTAGLGTKHLGQGQEEILEALDRLAHQLVWESRGLMKITVFSDHGHQLVPAEWVDFRAFLGERGWGVTERLEKPKDVVVIDYGLVTYASFATRNRTKLAEALLEHDGVDLVTYASNGSVAVCADEGRARIEHRGGRYRYVRETGDPLHLAAVCKQAADDGLMDADGFADGRTWLRLTAGHAYPDAVVRLWRAFHGITEHVPDVIASLKDGYSAGLPSRAARYPDGASTHGDLAAKSSTAFIMSTAGPVPEAAGPLRSRDLPKVLPGLLGRPWPPARRKPQ